MMKSLLVVLLSLSMPRVASSLEAAPRESITFLLGEDENPALPMFRTADFYFQTNPLEKTDRVIRTARSLKEVHDYLVQYPPKGPWGVINLVVHANDQGRMDLPLLPGGIALNVATLREELSHGSWSTLPETTVDSQSELRIHGCSVGKDVDMLRLISRAFVGNRPQRSLVRASRWYTCFQSTPEGCSRFLCQAWSLAFPPGERPTDQTLAKRFHQANPNETLDVLDALSRQSPRCSGDTFHYETSMRIQWTVLYGDAQSVPSLPSRSQKRAWLRSQSDICRSLMMNGLAFDQLCWEITSTEQNLGGITYPGLVAMGLGRSVHLLRALKSRTGEESTCAWDDDSLYATVR